MIEKSENLASNPFPSGHAAIYFRSVIVFGLARILKDETEKMVALRKLGERYSPGDEKALSAEISKGFARLLMVEIVVDHISGKEAIGKAPGRTEFLTKNAPSGPVRTGHSL